MSFFFFVSRFGGKKQALYIKPRVQTIRVRLVETRLILVDAKAGTCTACGARARKTSGVSSICVAFRQELFETRV